LIEPGHGSVGAGAESGISFGNRGSGGELSVSLGGFTASSEEEAKGEVWLKQVRAGGDGTAIAGFRLSGLVEGILNGAEVVEDLRVFRILLGERREQTGGGRVILAGESIGGLGTERILLSLRLSGGVASSGRELGEAKGS
jgi:hypothetical protein